MTADEIIGKLHRACTQIRFAIAVYEQEVLEGENTAERLAIAQAIIAEVQEELETHDGEEGHGADQAGDQG